ncbi:MAG: glycine zipper 2TM domain-containing protein [Steroidobacteraceae bacterium]
MNRNSRLLRCALPALVGLTLVTGVAQAGRHGFDNSRADYARVVDVQPLVERVRYREPVEQCHEVARPERGADRTGATLLGGVLGAVVGHQIGSGDGRRVATIAGALVGGAMGNEAANRNDARRYRDDPYYGERVRYEQHCSVRDEVRYEERVRAYRVTYRYAGREYVTELPYDPGSRLRVAVDARPL